MANAFFDQRFDNGVNVGVSWFGINLMVSFHDITQNIFGNLEKISNPDDLEICSTWSLLLSLLMTRKVSIAQ